MSETDNKTHPDDPNDPTFRKVDRLEQQRVLFDLNRVFTCPICGQHKIHFRLYGYLCSNREHTRIEQTIMSQAIHNNWTMEQIENRFRELRGEPLDGQEGIE